jgi:hypothetical protein
VNLPVPRAIQGKSSATEDYLSESNSANPPDRLLAEAVDLLGLATDSVSRISEREKLAANEV